MKKFLSFILFIIAVIAAIFAGWFAGMKWRGDDPMAVLAIGIENKKLTKENFKEITEEFAEKNKESDNLYYYTYSALYYSLKSMENIDWYSDDTENIDTNSNMYGKTINELIQDGKNLMKANHTTLQEFKDSLNELSTTSTNNDDDIIYLNQE